MKLSDVIVCSHFIFGKVVIDTCKDVLIDLSDNGVEIAALANVDSVNQASMRKDDCVKSLHSSTPTTPYSMI
jgi:hypothetical protein